MKSTRARFVMVAISVCLFALGMATFLNYFKYKATVNDTVRSRVLVVSGPIEQSVQASLAIGLNFADLGILNALLERQKSSDTLIQGIDVFDTAGKILYSTEAARVGKPVTDAWLNATRSLNKRDEWSVEESSQLVTGSALRNNFDLNVGFLAVRYSKAYVDAATQRAGERLLKIAVPTLLGVCVLAPLLLLLVMRRFDKDMQGVEAALQGQPDAAGPFDETVADVRAKVAEADAELEAAQADLIRITAHG